MVGSLWRSCGEGGPCRWWLFGTEQGQLLHGTALVCDAGKNRELVDWSSVQAAETVRKAVLSIMSSFLVWELLHQTGEQYSAAEKTSAWVEVWRVLVKVPQVVPDK